MRAKLMEAVRRNQVYPSRRKFMRDVMLSYFGTIQGEALCAALGRFTMAPEKRYSPDPQLHENLLRIDKTMKTSGIYYDANSKLMYFSGYSYKTLYDWDSYFEGIVQLELGWAPEYMMNGVRIFLDLQREDGFIRRLNTPSSSEEAEEMVKPFLAQISLLISKKLGHTEWLSTRDYERMRKYILFWLTTLTKDHGTLSYWRSAPHTGMDTQHERAGHWKADFDNGVDLNSYLYRECLAFSLLATSKKLKDDAALFRQKAEEKKEAIRRLCWNESDGFFYDIDNRTGRMIPVKSIAGFAPLWARIATEHQAKRLVEEHLVNKSEFWRKFPLSSLSATEKGYTEDYLTNDVRGSLWRANTWIPTNYYIFHGLNSYGYKKIAAQLANITYQTVLAVGDDEYYSSDSVKGCGLKPFWGWSLLAYLMPWEDKNNLDPTAINLTDPIVSAL